MHQADSLLWSAIAGYALERHLAGFALLAGLWQQLEPFLDTTKTALMAFTCH